MLFAILFCIMIAVSLIIAIGVPLAFGQSGELAQKGGIKFMNKMDRVLEEEDIRKAYRYYLLGPIVLGAAGYLLMVDMRLVGLIVGVAAGILAPRMYVQGLVSARKEKFYDQLMDALMIMSSSFRGGLSLVQAIEAVVDEMPNPIKHEFGIVMGENKMGVTLDESLNRLYKRLPSPSLQQMVTAILLARETGGNLPLIFSRIVSTMRERKKIEQNLKTLTVQGKIQAVVMTGLPVFFYLGVSSTNPHFFDGMKQSPDGQKLLIICGILWVVGAVSIWKISKFKEF